MLNDSSAARQLLTVMVLTALLVASTVVHGTGKGRASGNLEKPVRVFESEATMAVTIRAPWRELGRNKREKRYPATLAYVDAAGQTHTLELTVERRGVTRQEVCSFPPIKLRFDKQAIKATPFRGSASIKLVTHCDKGERWKAYPVIEMLAYRINNLLTDFSFRVRPLSIIYVDSRNDAADAPRFGFIIEDDDDLAKRHDLERLESAPTRLSQLSGRTSGLNALFQYMIGNTDWSMLGGPSTRCCHNTVLLGSKTLVDIHAVPYDFDSAGLVDAHYAAPSEKLSISEVSERVYRGLCLHNDQLEGLKIEFLQKEAAILDLIRSEARLDPSSRRKAHDYLLSFFDMLRDPAAFESNVTAKCRK